MFIRIGGVPGVGKTSIINSIIEACRKRGFDDVIKIKGGDLLLDILNVANYDELRAIPELIRESARPEMFRRMYQEDLKDPNTIRLRDAHYSLWNPELKQFTIFPLQPEDKEQMLNMVCVIAPKELVRNHREKDHLTRGDRSTELDQIEKELYQEHHTYRQQLEILNLPVITVNNQDINIASRELVCRAFPETYHHKVELENSFQHLPGKERLG